MNKINIQSCSVLFAVLLFALFICEYVIYFIVIGQCSWPKLEEESDDRLTGKSGSGLRAMFIADTHLLGPYRGHWFDKLRREWQMYRAFQTSVSLFNPEVVFILGDLFDEGQYCTDKQFDDYIERFAELFHVPKTTRIYAIPGNHDLGFHYRLRYNLFKKFNEIYKTSVVQFKNLKGNYFIMINSMAMHGDDCYFCATAEEEIHNAAKKLNCLKNGESCDGITKLKSYSRPIVLQHFPMYRESDGMCSERDAAPEELKYNQFREKWECLSHNASEMIYDLLNPRLILTGHTHHGCKVLHRKDILEYTIPAFNWRGKKNPTFMLGIFTPNNYEVTKCDMPNENTVIYFYLATIFGSIVYLIIMLKCHRKKLFFFFK